VRENILTAFHMERSKYDVQHFYEWLGYNWGNHIGEWLDLYGERGDAQVHRVCIIAPRDHSKSTTLRIKALHMLLFQKWRGKPFKMWLFSSNKDLAANRLEEMRQDLKRHPELSRMLDPKKGNKLELHLTNGAWIKATSVGSGIRGEHPAAIILDDILDDQNDMSYEAYQTWFRKKMTPMLSPGTSIFCVGTPMSMNDLYHTEMLNNQRWNNWVKGSILNYDEWRNDPDNIEAVCLWPEERPIEFLLEQREAIGELAFTQEYLCKVVDDDSAVFPSTLTRKNLDIDTVLQNDKLYSDEYVIGFDPSHGIGKDYSVMVCMRRDEDNNLHLVNIWRRNDFPPVKQIDQIASWNEKYDRPLFAFESVGFQHLYQSLIREKNLHLNVKMSKVSNKTLKQGLMTRLRTWFEQGRIILPYGDHDTRKMVNILLDELESHVWKEGDILDKGRHNDMVMALAHAVDQFANITSDIPMMGSGVDMNKWGKPSKQKNNRRPRNTSSKYVTFF
jgi:hypothetical protein